MTGRVSLPVNETKTSQWDTVPVLPGNAIRIRSLLLCCFGLVGALALGESAYGIIKATSDQIQLASAAPEIDALQLSLAVTEQLAKERSSANTAFAQGRSVDVGEFAPYVAARAEVDAAWMRLGLHEPGIAKRLLAPAERFKGARTALAAALAEAITCELRRPADFVARFSGEEFAVILPDTDQAGAAAMAERIRSAVQLLSIAHEGHSALVATISVGVAVAWPRAGGDAERDLLKIADAALYLAKTQGRNRIHLHKAETTCISADAAA